MGKNSWIGVVVAVIALGALVWIFRGRPAGDTTIPTPGTTGIATITPTPQPLTGGSPAPSGEPAAPTESVSITASGFAPATLTVAVGSTVTFTNSDTAAHQVASAPHPTHTAYPPLNGPVMAQGDTHTVTFSTAGTFGYHDHLNPGVTGTIVVQ